MGRRIGKEPLRTLASLVVLFAVACSGAPGSGKTTFLNYLALTHARNLLDEGQGLVARRLGAAPPQDL